MTINEPTPNGGDRKLGQIPEREYINSCHTFRNNNLFYFFAIIFDPRRSSHFACALNGEQTFVIKLPCKIRAAGAAVYYNISTKNPP